MKELDITPAMEASIYRVNGNQRIDLSKIAVFESRSLNTRPLRRRTGLFAKAITRKNVLDEMAAFLNASDEGIPLHIMHNTELLNVGRLFEARVDQARDGEWELTSVFYIPRSEAELIERINTGVTDQVSIGIQGQRLLCSHCDFDYRQGDMMNLMSLTCDEGHEIGVGGVHLYIDGLDQWMEQSIVDTGAAGGARIVNKENAHSQARDDFYRMAAKSHQNDHQTYTPLIANLNEILSEEKPTVDKAELETLLKAAFAEQNESVDAKLAAKDEEIAAAVERADAAEARVAELEAAAAAEPAAEKVAELEAALETATSALATVTTFLKDQATKAQVAAGVKTPVEPETIEASIEVIEGSGRTLAGLFAKEETEKKNLGERKPAPVVANFNAFKRNDK